VSQTAYHKSKQIEATPGAPDRLDNNPGLDKALAAAEAVTGVAIFPNFSAEQRAKGLTDFNDLAIQNPEVVSRQLDEVLQGVREQRLAATQSGGYWMGKRSNE
jgi:phage/plasmid primase-like uncharacterized protein